VQAVLAQHARVSELGRMALSLAHEVKQPLTAIGNYLAGMRRLIDSGRGTQIGDAIEAAQGQTRRASELIDHLRDFIGRREGDQRAQDLPASIDQAIRLAQVGTLPVAVEIERQFDPSAQRAVFDRVQIEQVIFNLVRNAIEAMAETPKPRVSISTHRRVGGLIEIVIADTGPGLDLQVRARIFEPFVSTKSEGMGVGLSICRFIVEAHGGSLGVADNPGGGTVFRFTVPAAPTAEGQNAQP
jgi:two-component system sensor kinase FixL